MADGFVERVVRHAVFAYVDPDGVNRMALRGERIRIDGDELERAERFEAVVEDEADLAAELAALNEDGDGDVESPPADADDAEVEVEESAGDEPADDDESARPARAAAKEAWVDFAVAHGADRGEAEAMTKADLIDAFGA